MVKPLPDMSAHIDALRLLLEGAGITVHVGEVLDPLPALPYALISVPPGVGVAVNVSDDQEETSETVRVTVVDDDPLNCLRTVTAVRRVLHRAVLDVPSRVCFPLRLTGSMPVAADREVTRTDTGRHPFYAVDEWLLESTPTD